MNNFAKCCKTKPKKKKHLHVVRNDSDSSDTESVSIVKNNSGGIYGKLKIEKTGDMVQFQIDSRATVNVIPRNIAPDKLEKSDCTLKMYNNTSVKPVGKCFMLVRNPVNMKTYNVLFQVVNGNVNPLISRKAAEQMKLITLNYENFLHSVELKQKEATNQVFDGALGEIPCEVTLRISDDVKPVQCPVRRIPHSLKSKVKLELDDLVKRSILKEVTKQTEWCSQISAQTKKNGSLRLYIDPQQLNRALLRERCMLPVINDILP